MRLLLAEDEKSLSKALKTILERNHYLVDAVWDGQSALEQAQPANYDAIILDIMMPKLDGISVLRQIRKNGSLIPVLMLTAKAEEEDKVAGLDSGANDYLTKPFSSAELLARIRAMTRLQEQQFCSKLHMGNVTLDRATFEVSTPYGCFRLANQEFQMLELMMCNPRNRITTERFREKIWRYEEKAEDTVVWMYLSYLRQKLVYLHADIQINLDHPVGYHLEMVK
ncbi:MAG: response regulator transcription factor [Clostridiales bacterium]|nr:response regulator transcription factor [Clostridiales bacterium]